MVLEEIDFEISRSYLLLRLCHIVQGQTEILTLDFKRLRLGLQIGIFGIIARGSYFPEIARATTDVKLQIRHDYPLRI